MLLPQRSDHVDAPYSIILVLLILIILFLSFFLSGTTKVLLLPPSPHPVSKDTSRAYPCPYSYDLDDQLSTSPWTRFHAVYMFVRYLLRIVAYENVLEPKSISNERHSQVAKKEHEDEELGADPHFLEDATRAVIWDIAVGCLSLSVKLHRDALAPLYPVCTFNFLSLAPHSMAYNDLEASQHDIVQAFSFSLGGHTKSAAPGGLCREKLGERLLGVTSEPDILRYPVSLLTLSALISGITVALLGHYQVESESLLWRHRQLSLHGTRLHSNCNFCHWTDTDLQDIQAQAQRNYAKRPMLSRALY